MALIPANVLLDDVRSCKLSEIAVVGLDDDGNIIVWGNHWNNNNAKKATALLLEKGVEWLDAREYVVKTKLR